MNKRIFLVSSSILLGFGFIWYLTSTQDPQNPHTKKPTQKKKRHRLPPKPLPTQWLEAKEKGAYKTYHNNGKPKEEISLKDGKRHGPTTEYYDNGKIRKVSNYKAGQLSGQEKEYFKTGEIKAEINYGLIRDPKSKQERVDRLGTCTFYRKDGSIHLQMEYLADGTSQVLSGRP